MTLKTFSDKAKTFTFTYEFKDLDTALVAGHALLGYMTGTYCQPVISLTYKDKGTLVAEYVEDHKLNKTFKRICDSFKDYHKQPEEGAAFEECYKTGSACFNSKSQRILRVCSIRLQTTN